MRKLLLSFLLLLAPAIQAGTPKKCLLVMSYHQGYEWNDGIEKGVRGVIQGRCKLKVFYMDTKRNTSEAWGKRQALMAKNVIAMYRPDVVIATDDNASRYLVKPYFRDARLPFVFCGINWTAEEYGYPYRNTTGMIEVAPVNAMIKRMRVIVPGVRRGMFLSSNTRTEHKDFERFRRIYAAHGIRLDAVFVNSLNSWKSAYLDGQRYDFLLIGNNAGIKGWNKGIAAAFARKHARKLSTSFYDWMMPYTIFALTKRPEEQGIWAGKSALAILSGIKPADIPVVVNRRWDLWINASILKSTGIRFPDYLLYRARMFK